MIPDRDAYNQEIMRQLNNNTFYRKLHGNSLTELKTKVRGCLNDLLERGEITEDKILFSLVVID